MLPAISPRPCTTSTAARIGPPLVLGATAFLVAGLVLGDQLAASGDDPCAVPAGVDVAALGTRERGLVARRVLACADLAHDRITRQEYRTIVQALEVEWARPAPTAATALPVWATTVRRVSTQFGDPSWAATRVLGAPDVYPAHGDIERAWASLGPDDRPEWIEVGFDRPRRIAAIVIYETFNPGAIDRVEIRTADGNATRVYEAAAAPMGESSHRRVITLDGCTADPVDSVAVYLDSESVPGWNELDAIGVVPCE